MEFPRWLDPRRIYQDPKRLLNPMGVRGGAIYGYVADKILDATGAAGPVRGAVQGALSAPIPALMPVAALIGADMYNPVGASEEEELRKAQERDRALRERGTQPGDGVKPDTIPTAPQLPRPQVPESSQRPTNQNTVPPTVPRERVPAASSPIPAVATGGNPSNAVEAVEGAAVSALEKAMMDMGPTGGYESFKSSRLGDAIRGAQEDILRRRFG